MRLTSPVCVFTWSKSLSSHVAHHLVAPAAEPEDAVGLVDGGAALDVAEAPVAPAPALGDQAGVQGLGQLLGDAGGEAVPQEVVGGDGVGGVVPVAVVVAVAVLGDAVGGDVVIGVAVLVAVHAAVDLAVALVTAVVRAVALVAVAVLVGHEDAPCSCDMCVWVCGLPKGKPWGA